MSLPSAPDAYPQHLCGHTTFGGAIQVLCGNIPQQQTRSGAMVCVGRRCPVELAQCWRTDALLGLRFFWQASYQMALPLSSLALFFQEVHGSRGKPHPQQCLPRQEAEAEGPPSWANP